MDDFNHNNNNTNMTPESRGDEHTEPQQPTMEQPTEEPRYTEPRTPYQTPVQHPPYHQTTQQQSYSGAPYAQDPMGEAPQPPKKKKHGKAVVIGLCSVAAACLLFAGGAMIGHLVYTDDGSAVKASAQAGEQDGAAQQQA